MHAEFPTSAIERILEAAKKHWTNNQLQIESAELGKRLFWHWHCGRRMVEVRLVASGLLQPRFRPFMPADHTDMLFYPFFGGEQKLYRIGVCPVCLYSISPCEIRHELCGVCADGYGDDSHGGEVILPTGPIRR